LKNWLLGLASVSALAPMVFAQVGIGTPRAADGPAFGIGRPRLILAQEAGQETAPKVHVPTPKDTAEGEKKDEEKKDEEKKDEEKKDEGPNRLFPDAFGNGWKIYGFIYGTGNYNFTNGSGTRYNGPMTMNDQEGVFLNQFYVTLEKAMKDEFSVGGRLDTFYGNDYNASQSRGFELRPTRIAPVQKWNSGQDYGIVVPQLYAEVGTSKASLVVGHFWTPIGYTVVPANGNFFNTMPYGFMAGQPFTHWGAMAKFAPNDNWSGYFSVVNGWDALDRPRDNAAILAGVKYNLQEKKGYLAFNTINGLEPENLGPGYGFRSLLNPIVSYNLSDNTTFVFENTTDIQENHGGLGTSVFYSLLPHLFYKINDCWKAGVRYEYAHDPGGFISGTRRGNPNVGPFHGNMQALATGLNWAPNGSKNLVIRPELQYNWFQGAAGSPAPFDAGQHNNQLFFVLGGVLQF